MFVLDTNVLFNIYRYSPKLREGLVNTLTTISERLWIPHQVAFEYYDNKPIVISNEIKKYKIIEDIISKSYKDIQNEISKNDLLRKHMATSEITAELTRKLEDSFKEINRDLLQIIEKYPKEKDFENINKTIVKLLNGKVGKPYSVEKLEQICQEGKLRCKLMLPPGYEDVKDKSKHGIRKYGDLILWFQIIDAAKEKKKPIILISEDLKDDWWWSPSDTRLGPRPELIQEFTSETNMLFYMYSLDQFMEYANKYIDTKIEEELIKEAKEYRVEEAEADRVEEERSIKEMVSLRTLRFPIQSSNISSVGYDPIASTLEIEFHSGGIYQYYGVPRHVYDGLMKAESKGSYFHHNIKMAGYPYKKVG